MTGTIDSQPATSTGATEPETFRHEALLYAGLNEFAAGTSAFIREGLAEGEPVLVVVDRAKITALQKNLGDDAARVRFEDMSEIGSNPAKIIPAWRDFVNENTSSGRPFRGIGEPVSPDRSPAALVECQRHEALLNLAFDGPPAWRLMCPYDAGALPRDVIDEAFRSHPTIRADGKAVRSTSYRDLSAVAAPFDLPLAPPAVTPEITTFELGSLSKIRAFVSERAHAMGLSPAKTGDLVLALNEVATNSLRHGGGKGELRLWRGNGFVLGEISDRGRIDQPLIGRERPVPGQAGGLGLWLANQVCDLVQIRTFPEGSVVRIHMRID